MTDLDTTIEAEIARRNTSPNGRLPARFNNMPGVLPGGRHEREADRSDSENNIPGHFADKHNSDHFRSRTYCEFLDDCRAACEKAGYDPNFLHEQWMKTYGDEVTDEEWFNLAKPVYRILRRMGYNGHDISS